MPEGLKRTVGVNRVWASWKDFARHQQRRGLATPRAMQDAAEIGAEIMTNTTHYLLEHRLYAIPIPQGKKGTPKWKRSRHLLEADQFVAVRGEIRHQNPTPYAEHRYNLGLAGHRQPRYTLAIQWPDEAWKLNKRAVQQIYRDHLRQAMEHPEDFI